MVNTDKIEVLELFDEFETRLENGVNNLHGEFAKLKAGRANPHLLDKITVDYYGTPTPIKQVGNISVPEARLLVISVWDKSILKNVEKAIIAANIGITPNNDGNVIRLVFPELTQDSRKALCKEIKAMSENVKVSPRNATRETTVTIKKPKKAGQNTEDEAASYEKEVDKMLSEKTGEIDSMTKNKEDEVMTV